MGEFLRRLPIAEQGAMPYLWLVYAGGIPISLIGVHSPRLIALQLGLLAVFLVCYFAAYGRRGRAAVAFAAAVALIGALASPTDGWATTYFVYAATFLAWGLPARTAYIALAVFAPLVALDCWLTHVYLASAIFGIVFIGIVGVACVNAAEQQRAHCKLQQAYEQNERLAKIAERERIARDLHDVLGHTLSLISLKSQLASKLAERDPQRAVAEIRDVERIARTSLDELRAAVAGYRAAGIPDELAHARDVLASAGLQVDCEADDSLRLAPADESVLALAIREAVTNVVRHARATAVRLRLRAAGETCRFEIEDDGVGGTAAEGMGLSGMRERVESHGGSLERTTDGGTRLIVTLPLAPEAAR